MSSDIPSNRGGEVVYQAEDFEELTRPTTTVTIRHSRGLVKGSLLKASEIPEVIGDIIDLAQECIKRLDALRNADEIRVFDIKDNFLGNLNDFPDAQIDKIYQSLLQEIDNFAMGFEDDIDPRIILNRITGFDVEVHGDKVINAELYCNAEDAEPTATEPNNLPN